MRSIIALALSAAAFAAHADTRVGLHIGTVHSERGFNDVNPGVYVEHNGYTAGVLKNSESRTSVYAGYTWHYGNLGLTAGAITGYRRAQVMPLVTPSIRFNVGPGAIRLAYLPKVDDTGAHGVHFTYEWTY